MKTTNLGGSRPWTSTSIPHRTSIPHSPPHFSFFSNLLRFLYLLGLDKNNIILGFFFTSSHHIHVWLPASLGENWWKLFFPKKMKWMRWVVVAVCWCWWWCCCGMLMIQYHLIGLEAKCVVFVAAAVVVFSIRLLFYWLAFLSRHGKQRCLETSCHGHVQAWSPCLFFSWSFCCSCPCPCPCPCHELVLVLVLVVILAVVWNLSLSSSLSLYLCPCIFPCLVFAPHVLVRLSLSLSLSLYLI